MEWPGVQHFSSTLNKRLADRQFIATKGFSIADITAVVVVDFARIVKVKPTEQHSHLGGWQWPNGRRCRLALCGTSTNQCG